MELRISPSTWVRKLGPIVFDRQKDRSGHYSAWDAPESLMKIYEIYSVEEEEEPMGLSLFKIDI